MRRDNSALAEKVDAAEMTPIRLGQDYRGTRGSARRWRVLLCQLSIVPEVAAHRKIVSVGLARQEPADWFFRAKMTPTSGVIARKAAGTLAFIYPTLDPDAGCLRVCPGWLLSVPRPRRTPERTPQTAVRGRIHERATARPPVPVEFRKSQRTGKSYLSGWLGKSRLIGFQGEEDRYGNPTFNLFVQGVEPRPEDKPRELVTVNGDRA